MAQHKLTLAAHVFGMAGHIGQNPSSEWKVSMSFLQIYLETIQVSSGRSCVSPIPAAASDV